MELRVRCGASDRAARHVSVWNTIKEAGPVWVIEVKRTRMPEWFAMWFCSTTAEAEANLARAIGWDGNGGVVTDARITEGVAYWSQRDSGVARRPRRRPQQAHTSLEAMGF
ncbi:MAG: hypothetical protein JW395_2859 [Nitrospira sp.]|nr:hypothetical protein [Nitrospira sp.]